MTTPSDYQGNQWTITANQDSQLRVTFDVRQVFYQARWFAEIVIYNLDQKTSNLILGSQTAAAQQPSSSVVEVPIEQGMICQLKAGYRNGKYGTIWNGPVFQALFVREEAVDFKIVLNCVLGLGPLRNTINYPFAAKVNQSQLVQQMANLAFGIANQPVTLSPNFKNTAHSRGGVLFGTVQKYFNEAADENNMQQFFDGNGVYIASVNDPPLSGIVTTFSPPPSSAFTTGFTSVTTEPNGIIIDTPEQTQLGVWFRALLDPTVFVSYPAQQVEIDNTQIVKTKTQIGELPTVLDQNGIYVVVGARYLGDSRGTPWYIEVDGLTRYESRLQMLNGYN